MSTPNHATSTPLTGPAKREAEIRSGYGAMQSALSTAIQQVEAYKAARKLHGTVFGRALIDDIEDTLRDGFLAGAAALTPSWQEDEDERELLRQERDC